MADVYHMFVFPWEISHLWEAANRDFAASIYTLDLSDLRCRCLALPCSRSLQGLLSSNPPPCVLRSFLAEEKTELKMSWRKGAWRWLSCGNTCGHPVFTSLLSLWVSSPLVWLLGLKSYLPPACPCTHPSFPGWSKSPWSTKEVLKLPLQLTEGERHCWRGSKSVTATLHWLWKRAYAL